jgi:hypothetical protein
MDINEPTEMAAWMIALLLKASGAVTPEDQARVLWRASDILWTQAGKLGLALPRAFNDMLQDRDLPWVDDLFTHEEREALWGLSFTRNE